MFLPLRLRNNLITCDFRAAHNEYKVIAVLGNYAVSISIELPKFKDTLLVPSSSLNATLLKIGLTYCLTVFENNYQVMQQKIPNTENVNLKPFLSKSALCLFNIDSLLIKYPSGSISFIRQTDPCINSNAAEGIYHRA